MIIDIEKAPYIKANKYEGLNGIFVYGKGILYDTREDAQKYKDKYLSKSVRSFNLQEVEYNGKIYFNLGGK